MRMLLRDTLLLTLLCEDVAALLRTLLREDGAARDAAADMLCEDGAARYAAADAAV